MKSHKFRCNDIVSQIEHFQGKTRRYSICNIFLRILLHGFIKLLAAHKFADSTVIASKWRIVALLFFIFIGRLGL